MPKQACPICGDPNAFLFWQDAAPPEGCPYDPSWSRGGPATIHSVIECSPQMKKAWQAAEFRKLVPDAFDERGVMKRGSLSRVLRAFVEAHPDKALAI